MKAKFFSLTASEFFLRGSKFLFFLLLTNVYAQNVVYEYGYFSALFSLFFVFSDMGYQTYLTKELASSKSTTSYIKGVNIALFRVLLFLFVSLFVLSYYFFSQKEFFFYIFLLFLTDAILAMSFSFYRAKQNFKAEMKLKFNVGLIFLVVCFLGLFSFDIKILFTILSVSLLCFSSFDALFIQKKYFVYFFKKFDIKSYINSIKKSFYIFAGSLATIIYLRVDILMLEWFSFSNGVVYYTIASRVLELSLIVPAMISAILLPKFVKAKTADVSKDIKTQFLIGVVVLILFLSTSTFLIHLLFSKYLQTILILNILLLSTPFMLVSNYGFTYFIAKDFSKYYMIIACVMVVINFAANYVFIPIYGYEAAAWTTLATEVIGTLLVFKLLQQLA